MKRGALLLGMAIGALAVPGLAQDAPASAIDQPIPANRLEGPLARLPEKMFGIDCRVSPLGDDAVSSMCFPRELFRGPIIGVTTAAVGRDVSYEKLVEQMRDSFHESGALRVIEEEPFTVSSAPGVIGMRAIYQTGTGRKFTWSAAYHGNLTRVIITAPDNAKREDFEDEVMAKVFGPDRYVPVESAAS